MLRRTLLEKCEGKGSEFVDTAAKHALSTETSRVWVDAEEKVLWGQQHVRFRKVFCWEIVRNTHPRVHKNEKGLVQTRNILLQFLCSWNETHRCSLKGDHQTRKNTWWEVFLWYWLVSAEPVRHNAWTHRDLLSDHRPSQEEEMHMEYEFVSPQTVCCCTRKTARARQTSKNPSSSVSVEYMLYHTEGLNCSEGNRAGCLSARTCTPCVGRQLVSGYNTKMYSASPQWPSGLVNTRRSWE